MQESCWWLLKIRNVPHCDRTLTPLFPPRTSLSLPPVPVPVLTLVAVSQVAAPQHPGVEAERVPLLLRAEEALRAELQRVQRQRAGARSVRAGLLQHQLRSGRVHSPAAAALEAGAEHSGGGRGGGGRGGGGVQGVREAERRGPNGFVPGAAAGLLPH